MLEAFLHHALSQERIRVIRNFLSTDQAVRDSEDPITYPLMAFAHAVPYTSNSLLLTLLSLGLSSSSFPSLMQLPLMLPG